MGIHTCLPPPRGFVAIMVPPWDSAVGSSCGERIVFLGDQVYRQEEGEAELTRSVPVPLQDTVLWPRLEAWEHGQG